MAALFAVPMLASLAAASPVHIGAHDRNEFVTELVADEPNGTVSVELLAQERHFDDLETELAALHAGVRFSDPRVGYFYMRVPRHQLLALLASSHLETVALTSSPGSQDFSPSMGRHPAAVPAIRLPITMVATTPLTAQDPYFPLAETGIVEFWKGHPTADGRGINIGFVDDGFDLLHPAIRQSIALTGTPVAKVLDMMPFTSAEEDNSWVVFDEPQTSREGKLAFAGAEWRVPTAGTYRGGIFASKLAPGLWYDPDKKNPAFTLSVGALWNPLTGEVWIDTDGDLDFSNNSALRDYAVAHEIDWFGSQEGDADHRIPFGIKIDLVRGAVWLSLNGSSHGTWTGSAASGNRLTGGLFDAPAPNARLLDFRSDDLAAILSAAARPEVDIINRSAGLGRPLGMGEETFAGRVLARAAAVYGKPTLAASEGAAGTIAISDYWSAQMMRRNAQVAPPYRAGVNEEVPFTQDGTVNILLAPSVTMPAVSRYFPLYYRGDDGRRYLAPGWPASPAPEGYAIGSNPSCTIAYASGVVASVLSLARQKGVRYDLTRLTNALFTGARHLSDFPARVQGHGLIRADGAWKQLAAMAQADDPANPVLTHFELARDRDDVGGVVQGYAEQFPGAGAGLERSLWITRRGGYAEARVYRFELAANDGVFKLAQSKVALPRDRAVLMSFTVRPQPGHHVSFISVIDAQTGVVMQKIPLQIRVPDRMEEVAPGVMRYRASIPSHRSQRHSFVIEPGVQAVRTLMEMPQFTGGEQMYFIASRDLSWMIRRAARPFDNALPPAGADQATRAVQPGPIDLFWENRSRREYESAYDPPAPRGPIKATLTLTQYTVAFEKGVGGDVIFHNRLADVTGRIEWLQGLPLRQSLRMGAQERGFAHVALVVPEKTTVLKAIVTSEHVGGSNTEVYAVDGTSSAPRVVKSVELKDGRAELVVVNPPPGNWKIAVWAREPHGRYDVETTALIPQTQSAGFARYPHNSTVALAAPAQTTHVALRIEPAGEDKEGVLIGLTSLPTN